jgi:leucyl aminopeptidase
MPLDDAFRREMDSPFADIKNVGAGRFGGASLGAAFLSEFIDEGRAWCHLDIAGTASQKGTKPTSPKTFATGYGVRLLNDFVESQE